MAIWHSLFADIAMRSQSPLMKKSSISLFNACFLNFSGCLRSVKILRIIFTNSESHQTGYAPRLVASISIPFGFKSKTQQRFGCCCIMFVCDSVGILPKTQQRFGCCCIMFVCDSVGILIVIPLGFEPKTQQRFGCCCIMYFCDSVGIRTQDPQLRRLLLYPAELRNQWTSQALFIASCLKSDANLHIYLRM